MDLDELKKERRAKERELEAVQASGSRERVQSIKDELQSLEKQIKEKQKDP